MIFKELPMEEQIRFVKLEFFLLAQSLFEDPIKFKSLAKDNGLTTPQFKLALKHINTFNLMDCKCCRKFDTTKFQVAHIERELEPILDIAKNIAQTKTY